MGRGTERSFSSSSRGGAARRRRRRLAALVLAAVATLVVFALRNRRPSGPREPDERTTTSAPGDRSPVVNHAGPLPLPAPPPAASDFAGAPDRPDPPPVIDSISLEKSSVCSGEENLVTVRAHTENGTDEHLHYVIDGRLGRSVPVTLWRTDRGVGKHVISVFGRGNVETTVPLPEYEVRDCTPPRMANVATRLRANTWADYDLFVTIALPRTWNQSRSLPSRPFEPVTYLWSFGDGESVATTVPVAQHSYEGRSQDSLYSYFLVGVEIYGKDGEVVRGRTSLALVNPAFEALKAKGAVALLVSLNPRFPQLGTDGRVTQEVRIWHTRPGPVKIEHIARTKYYEHAAGESPPEIVDVSSVLGATSIPPGKDGITTKVVLDPAYEPEVFSVTYRLAGVSEEGFPANGSFTVMTPPPVPRRDDSVPVRDPVLKARILAARQLLGKEYVDDEDLWQLERAGKFADLQVPPADPVPSEPTPPPPPPRPGVVPGAAPPPSR
jgi:hypothetical protein